MRRETGKLAPSSLGCFDLLFPLVALFSTGCVPCNGEHATRDEGRSRAGDDAKAEFSFGASASNKYSVLHPMSMDASSRLRTFSIRFVRLLTVFLFYFPITSMSPIGVATARPPHGLINSLSTYFRRRGNPFQNSSSYILVCYGYQKNPLHFYETTPMSHLMVIMSRTRFSYLCGLYLQYVPLNFIPLVSPLSMLKNCSLHSPPLSGRSRWSLPPAVSSPSTLPTHRPDMA